LLYLSFVPFPFFSPHFSRTQRKGFFLGSSPFFNWAPQPWTRLAFSLFFFFFFGSPRRGSPFFLTFSFFLFFVPEGQPSLNVFFPQMISFPFPAPMLPACLFLPSPWLHNAAPARERFSFGFPNKKAFFFCPRVPPNRLSFFITEKLHMSDGAFSIPSLPS